MINRLQKVVNQVSNYLLGALFLVMLLMAVFQVISRQVGLGLYWGDELVRMAVLWVTMIGAVVAVGDRKHIRIDLVDKFFGEAAKRYIQILICLITAAVCFAFGYFSFEMIKWDFIDKIPGVGAVPAWVFETIIPISAFFMGFRFTLQAFSSESS